jgi:hypothetical protein
MMRAAVQSQYACASNGDGTGVGSIYGSFSITGA